MFPLLEISSQSFDHQVLDKDNAVALAVYCINNNNEQTRFVSIMSQPIEFLAPGYHLWLL